MNPHKKDYCVVCSRKSSVEGPEMHPVKTIKNGYVCGECIGSVIAIMNVDQEESILEEQIGFFNIPELPCEKDNGGKNLSETVPEDQHCQKCGRVREDVDFSSVRGYQFLCDSCLQEEIDLAEKDSKGDALK